MLQAILLKLLQAILLCGDVTTQVAACLYEEYDYAWSLSHGLLSGQHVSKHV